MNLKYDWYRFKFNYGKHLPLKTPVDVSLELASVCNMKCSYCYHGDKAGLPFKQDFMSTELAEKVLVQASELGVNSLKFNWRGESTLHPDFRHITSIAKMLSKGSTFLDRLTNSNFKFDSSRDDIFEGLCNQTKVKVSYDSFNKEVFETQRKGGCWDTTTRNIDLFYNHKKRTNTELVIQCVRTQLNKDENFEVEIMRRWPGSTLSIRDVVEGRLNKDIDTLKVKTRDASNRQSCKQAHVRMIIHHDGKVSPCCPSIANNLILGDVNYNSLYEVFNNHSSRGLRKSLKNGSAFDLDPCKTCSSFESYKGFEPVWGS